MILKIIGKIANKLKNSFLDLVPIILVVSFFQIVVLQQPFPNLFEIVVGLVFVVIGLMLFIEGLEIGLFPLERIYLRHWSKKGVCFGFCHFLF